MSFHPYKKRKDNFISNKKILKKIKEGYRLPDTPRPNSSPSTFNNTTNNLNNTTKFLFNNEPSNSVNNNLFPFTPPQKLNNIFSGLEKINEVSDKNSIKTQTGPTVMTSHSQTGFTFDSPTINRSRSRSTSSTNTEHTNSKQRDYTYDYIITLEENNRFLRQIQSCQRRANYQNREYRKLQKKLVDLQVENNSLKETLLDRESETEHVRDLLSTANQNLRLKDKTISEWNRWYDLHEPPYEKPIIRDVESGEQFHDREEYFFQPEKEVQEVENLPKQIQSEYEQNLQKVAESVATSVLEEVSSQDILPNIDSHQKWTDLADDVELWSREDDEIFAN